MGLPEWCQTHSLKEFLELIEFGSIEPKKEKKMNYVETNVPEQDLSPVTSVVADEQAAEFLAKFGDKLDENGSVLVQTSEDVGTADTTVH